MRIEERSGVKRIKVLVVDDSAFMRVLIADTLNTDSEIEVIETARNGEDALEKVRKISPDVITMDVEMPKMDGIEATRHIMAEKPTPIIMLSAYTKKDTEATLEALGNGAFDFVTKPAGTLSLDIDKVKGELISKIKAASTTIVKKIDLKHRYRYQQPHRRRKYEYSRTERGKTSEKVVVIGSSTGGPKALSEILPSFPEDIPAAVLVVQHMPPWFTKSLAERLDDYCEIHVKEAEEDDRIINGSTFVAPGDYHMVANSNRIQLNKKPSVNAVRPSADVTMQSIAKVYGSNTIGIILTGMGKDGAEGMKAIKEKGGKTIVCDEKTSLIFGMPKSAIELGCVDKVVPLDEIAEETMKYLSSEGG